jgi:DNA-binding NarL/FixJ family response regulator
MRQLLSRTQHAAARAPQKADTEWSGGLTQREREVAVLAANGASNQAIATDCGISERTVKAHLTAVFEKLNLTDRLQLALRVHGIH